MRSPLARRSALDDVAPCARRVSRPGREALPHRSAPGPDFTPTAGERARMVARLLEADELSQAGARLASAGR